jgi:hypothetical protein
MSPTISREGGDLLVPLRHRLEHLPLLLAGPILRRTESDKVTVWVALKAPREVTLKIYATDANGSIIRNLLLEGTSSTIALGQYLHVVAVTAKPIEVGNEESERTGEFLNSNLKKGVRGQGSGVTEEDFHSFFVREPRMASNPSFLQPGHIYAYDLSFGTDEHNLANIATGSPR